jgi:hypothetical protein
MVHNLTLFKGSIGDLVKGNTYYFKDTPYDNKSVGRKYHGTSDGVSVFTKYDDYNMPRYIIRFILTKDGDHLNVVDTEPRPHGEYGLLYVKEQRGGRKSRKTHRKPRAKSRKRK